MSEPVSLEVGKRYRFRIKARSSVIGVLTLTNSSVCCYRATTGHLFENWRSCDTFIIGKIAYISKCGTEVHIYD